MPLLDHNKLKLPKTLRPFKGIFWFLFLFIFFDFLWKLFINEGENGESLIVLGKDFTQAVEPLCIWTADVSHWIVHNLLGFDNFRIEDTVIYFEEAAIQSNYLVDGKTIDFGEPLRFKVVWGCTGIKQMIMFAFILIFYFGPPKKKVWFIPLSLIFLNFINIVRIVSTVLLTKNGFPEWFIAFNEWNNNRVWENTQAVIYQFKLDWFELFHKDVFKWLYYDGVMFLLWLLWEEVFNIPYQKIKIRLLQKEKAPV